MSSTGISQPFPIFFGKDGQPLDAGFVYIGVAGQNPETNPIQVFWDADMQYPAPNPIRTIAGYYSNNGTPAKIFINGVSCSITVRNKNSAIVWTDLNSVGGQFAAFDYTGLNTANAIDGQVVLVTKDGISGKFRYDSTSTATPNGGTIIASENGGNWVRLFSGAVNVKWFGAVGDGVTDDAPKVQAAINAAIGSTVVVPVGRYRLASTVTISRSVRILGLGWEPYTDRSDEGGSGTTNPVGLGSYFYCDTTNLDMFSITAKSGVTFEDVAFDWNQPTPSATDGDAWTPTAYGWAIKTSTVEVLRIINVFMRNPVKGICFDTSAEKLFIDGLWAQNLGTLVDVDFAADVVRIENLHAWAFWSLNSNVSDYTRANSIAILSGRNDNPFFSNIFVISHLAAIKFKNSTTGSGVTNKFHLQNADFDILTYGIWVAAETSGVTGQITNYSGQGAIEITESIQIYVSGSNSRLQFTNFRSTQTYLNAIRIESFGNQVFMENVEFEDWGMNGSSEAVAVSENNMISLGSNINWKHQNYSSSKWSIGGPAAVIRVAGGSPASIHNNNVDQSIETGVSQKVALSTTAYDVGGFVVSDQSRILPDIPGYYRVVGIVTFNNITTGSYLEAAISTPDSNKIAHTQTFATGNDTNTVVVDTTIYRNGLDQYVELWAQQNGGSSGSILGDPQLTKLTIFRIG